MAIKTLKCALLASLPWLVVASNAAGTAKLTEAELAKHDGTGDDKTIYLAINGTIYDVSASPAFYGPGGHYHHFTGRDASRAWVSECWDSEDQLTWRMDGLEAMFMPKYLDEEMQAAADGKNEIEGAENYGGQAGLKKAAEQMMSKFGRVDDATIKERREADRVEAEKAVHDGLAHWINFFGASGKYQVVGEVVRDDSKPEPPALCDAALKKRPTKGGKFEAIMKAGGMPGMGGKEEKPNGGMPDFVQKAEEKVEEVAEAMMGDEADDHVIDEL